MKNFAMIIVQSEVDQVLRTTAGSLIGTALDSSPDDSLSLKQMKIRLNRK